MKGSWVLFAWLWPILATGAENDGYVALFDGKDLTGWVNVNCAPGTFTVRDGIIV